MKNRLTCLVMTFLLLVALPPNWSARVKSIQNPPVDLGAFTKEIMVLDFKDGQDHLAMWLPYEFFVAATLAEGKTTRAAAERDLDYLKPYITIIVQSSIDQPDGSSVYASEKEMRARTVLKLSDGTEAVPLGQVPPLVSATLAAMKAIIIADGGAGTANMHILVFSALTRKGEKIVDTTRKSSLTLVLKSDSRFKERSFTWRTPFDAVAAAPDCPRCKAGVSAKWSYCPYCGQKLPHE